MLDSKFPFMRHTKKLDLLNLYQLFFQRYGIGCSISKLICDFSGYHPNYIFNDVVSSYVGDKIRTYFKTYINELDFNQKKIISNDILRLIKLKSYRGMKHKYNLPVRGQRTRSNAINARMTNNNFVKIKK